jgi:hypothetical protein
MADLTEQQLLSQDPDILGLQRQRKLADLLTGQAFNQPQGQMISGHYVKPSNLQQALPMISAAIGGFTGANLDEKQQAMAEALRGKGNEAVQKVMQAYKQDPQAGLEMASALSQYPQVKALLPQLSKVAISEPTTDVKNYLYGQIIPEFTNYQERQANLKAPRTSIVNSMPPAETKYSQVTGELIAKRDDALRDAAENAQLSIDNIERQRSVLKSNKVITGFGAEPRLALAQFGQAIGAGGKDSNELVSNTQGLLASRASATLDAIKTSNLGSAQGFSNTDREFLEKAKLGGIKYTAESLNHQLDIEEKLARFSVDKYNNRLKQSPKSASGPLNLKPVTLTSPNNVVDYNSLK